MMGRKKSTLQERSDRMKQRRRVRFDDDTPFIELIKPQYHHLLTHGQIGKELRKLLVDGDDADLKALTFLRFRINGGYKHDVIHYWIRCLLDTIGRDGTMYGNAMIFRYLTSGHSNLRKSERTLQNAVYKTLTNNC